MHTLDDVLRRASVGAPAARSTLLTVLGEFLLPRPDGAWQEAIGRAVPPADPGHAAATAAYHRRFPRAAAGDDAVLVTIGHAPGQGGTSSSSDRSVSSP